jgi:hypothetical protein
MKAIQYLISIKVMVLFFLAGVPFAFMSGQEKASTGKVWIHVNNEILPEPVIKPDTVPPVIKIITPELKTDNRLVYSKPEINILGKITDDKSGINRIFINSEKYSIAEDGLFVKKIVLQKGENTIDIYAVDNNDNYATLNLVVDYVIEPSASTSQLNITGKYYALLIGVDKYEDPNLPNLDYPISDAEHLYHVLVAEYIFDKQNIIFLKNATRDDINNALDDLAKKVTTDDNLLIFYAGHGWWDAKADIGYWLPSDAKQSYKTDWFRNSTLCDYIREINSKHTLLITDACFGGSIFKTRSISMEAPKAIQLLYDLPSRKAMTSGTLTEVPDRSSFVKYLIERLDENDQKCLSSEQLFSSFRIAVINNSDVIPQYGEIKNVGDEGGDFIFIRRE